MGYCMASLDVNFTIKTENCKAALAALSKWAGKKYPSLQHGLTNLGWSAENKDNGDVIICFFDEEKYHKDEEIFKILAPHVTRGSYINMQGETNDFWQWYFDGKELTEKTGRLVFD